MTRILDNNPGIDFVYCDYLEKSIDGKIKKVSTKDNIFNTLAGGIMFKKNKLAKEGFYQENIKFAEYDLLLRTQGRWQASHIYKPLFSYDRREKGITGNRRWVKEALAELKSLYPNKIREIQKIRNY